jgi:lipid-binding SYLF domain-containing protein
LIPQVAHPRAGRVSLPRFTGIYRYKEKFMFRRSLFIAASVLALTVAGVGQGVRADASEQDVKTALAEFERTNPKVKPFLASAHGYAVFPSVGKGAIGIGGAYGDGLVYEKGKLIGSTSLSQVTIGFQLGGQAYRQLIVFQNKQALDRFKGENFEFDAQASGVAVTAGISFDAAYEHGVAIFTMAKGGLMYEASVGGQKFSFKPK